MKSETVVADRTRRRRLFQTVGPLLAILALLALLAFQAWAYNSRLTLSLGPRVILEPWLLGRGEVLYDNLTDLHTPLMPLFLAALGPLVPDGLTRARLVLVALLSLTTLLTFLVAWRRIGWLAGLWAAGFVVVWSPAFGFGKLWHESFLAPLYLLLMLCSSPGAQNARLEHSEGSPPRPRLPWRLLLAGFLGGLAVLVKQHAILVLAGFALWTTLTGWLAHCSFRRALRDLVWIGIPAILLVAAYAVYQYARAGSLASFLYWTVGYSVTSDYGSLAALAPTAAQVGAIASSCLLVPAAIVGCIDSRRAGDARWQTLGLAVVLLVASAATAYPRYSSFHLQASLPLLAWVSTWALAGALRSGGAARRFALATGVALSAFWLVTAGAAYRPVLKAQPQRSIKEYSDLVPLAREIRQAIGPEECVYLFPDDEATANLYYLLGCPAPRFWVFHYPWYQLDWIRDRILVTLEEQPPQWVVYFPGRWGAEQHAPEIMDYLGDHYRQEAALQWAEGEVRVLRRLEK